MQNKNDISADTAAAQKAVGRFHLDSRKNPDVRSLTRLVIGGIGLGADEFIRRLRIWEIETEERISTRRDQNTPMPGSDETSPADLARFALIGMLFSFQDNIGRSVGILGRVQRFAGKVLAPFFKPLQTLHLFSPTQRQLDQFIARGRREVDRWVSRGRQEDARSRQLASIAVDDVIEDFIAGLADNPEVKELVQTQSTGLANEVVEEVRERTVSADTFLEGVARSFLRMAPRTNLPNPPEKLIQSAESLRPPKKRSPRSAKPRQ